MKYYNYDIVFQEVPDEVSLAINITNCPNRCKGCHSPHLWLDEGIELDDKELRRLVEKYKGKITCICFMGGDANPKKIEYFSKIVQSCGLKTAWYSGGENIPSDIDCKNFNYIKIGPYIAELGALKSSATNQVFYKISPNGDKEKINYRFRVSN